MEYCTNDFYFSSTSVDNVKFVSEFISNIFKSTINYCSEEEVEMCFTSRAIFPEYIMKEMYYRIPNKDNFNGRCLSVNYSKDYVKYHKLDEAGWYLIE